MPELPEVETIRRRLVQLVVGQVIQQVTIFRDKSFQGHSDQLVGARITGVSRQAKVLIFELSNELSLLVHLKMTGQLIMTAGDKRFGGGHPTADWVQTLPSKHTRVMLQFADTTKTLFFNDQRVFGWMKVATATTKQQELARFGPDIDQLQDKEYFYAGLQRTTRPVKVALLDSQFVAGLGNIYVCDALNLARISPFRISRSLNRAESDRLFAAAQTVIALGISHQGTTFDGLYVGVDGFAGGYQTIALVYGRANQPCRQCQALIQKTKLAGRGTYYCPVCQE